MAFSICAHARVHAKEETLDEIKQSKEKRYDDIIKAFKTAPGQGPGQSTRERDAAITKHMGGDVHKGEIRRAMKRHFHTKGLYEADQIDELKQDNKLEQNNDLASFYKFSKLFIKSIADVRELDNPYLEHLWNKFKNYFYKIIRLKCFIN